MEKHYVDAFNTNNVVVIKNLYYTNRASFNSFAKRYNVREDDIADIYQEAFIALRKHAISGKLYEISSSLKTYLFGIGKHLIYKKLKEYSTNKSIELQLHIVENDVEEIIIESVENLTREQELLRYYFKQLGKSCQKMLTLSFYRGLTNDEIAQLEKYDSQAVVRSQKSRCLKTLKELIKNSTRK